MHVIVDDLHKYAHVCVCVGWVRVAKQEYWGELGRDLMQTSFPDINILNHFVLC